MTIDEQIKKADAKIAEIEAALIVAQEHRRELVNRGNLNKCYHEFLQVEDERGNQFLMCMKCGKERAL